MMRVTTTAVLAGALATAVIAAPQNQLVAPNFNPALKTVPYVPQSQSARAAACEEKTEAKAPVIAAKDEPTGKGKEAAHAAPSPEGTTQTDACPQENAQAATNAPQPIGPQQ